MFKRQFLFGTLQLFLIFCALSICSYFVELTFPLPFDQIYDDRKAWVGSLFPEANLTSISEQVFHREGDVVFLAGSYTTTKGAGRFYLYYHVSPLNSDYLKRGEVIHLQSSSNALLQGKGFWFTYKASISPTFEINVRKGMPNYPFFVLILLSGGVATGICWLYMRKHTIKD